MLGQGAPSLSVVGSGSIPGAACVGTSLLLAAVGRAHVVDAAGIHLPAGGHWVPPLFG